MGFTFEDGHLINVCESGRVMELQICTRCFWTMDRELNIDGIKLSNKKLTCPAVSNRSTDSGQVVIHAVTQCTNAYQHQQS